MSEHPPPAVNTLVEVVISGIAYSSRVEEVGDAVLAIAAPFGGGLDPPYRGSVLLIYWTSGGRGRLMVPVVFQKIIRGPLTRWSVEMAGPVRVEQRRRFVRAGGGEPLRVRRVGDEPAVMSGHVVDIGEGGLRGWVAGAEVAADDRVEVVVDLNGHVLTVEATVLRAGQHPGGPGRDLVVRFDLDDTEAGIVRRYVLHRQILARRMAADARH